MISLVCAMAGQAHAQAERNPFSLWYLDGAEPGWYFDAFAGIELEPAYTGSDEYSTEPDVSARAMYVSDSGHRYFISLGELGGLFDIGNDLMFAAVLEYEEGRENEDDPILTGFPEVEETVEAQLSLVKRWGNWSAALVAQPDILDRGKGFVYFAGLAYDTALSDRWWLSAGLDISFADAEHINTEVGISEDTAAITGLPAYDPDGGYKSSTISFGTGYEINEHWEMLFISEIEVYGGEMADSPLIDQEGDDINYELGIGVRYRF